MFPLANGVCKCAGCEAAPWCPENPQWSTLAGAQHMGQWEKIRDKDERGVLQVSLEQNAGQLCSQVKDDCN